MSRMSLEGIGEPHFQKFVIDNVFRGYRILPPGTVLRIDLVVADEMVFVEIEDTIFEIYSGTKQLLRLATISRIYNVGLVLITPFPRDPLKSTLPIAYYFRKTSQAGLDMKELWLVYADSRPVVLAIRLKTDKSIPLRPKCSEELLSVSTEELQTIGKMLEEWKKKHLQSLP